MALEILSNPIWLMWPELLMVAAAAIYLSATKNLRSNGPGMSSRVRLAAAAGSFSTASLVLLGIRPSLYTIIAIPVIPAPFVFAALIFRPTLVMKWTKTTVYLNVSVVASGLCWVAQVIWLMTR